MTPLISSRRRSRAAAVAALALAAAVAVSPSASGHEGHEAVPSTGVRVHGDELLISEAAREAVGMETAKVTLADLHQELTVNAHVELPWDQQAFVSTLVPGRVTEVLAGPGERVGADQKLARLESLELESLNLDLLQAERELQLADRLVELQRGLNKKGIVAGTTFLESRTRRRQAKIRLEAARQRLLALGLEPQSVTEIVSGGRPVVEHVLESPIDGTVAEADVHPGKNVQTTEHLYHIVDTSRLWLVGDVPETDIWMLRPGQSVEATFRDLPGQSFRAAIDRLHLTMDRQSETLGVVAEVDNRCGQLRPGMFGQMTIQIHARPQAIACPVAALIEKETGNFVLLRDGPGRYVRRQVEVGLRTRERVEIKSGLFPGDRVIVTGTRVLAAQFHRDGTRTNHADEQPTGSGAPHAQGQEPRANGRKRKPALHSPHAALSQANASHAVTVEARVELPPGAQAFAGLPDDRKATEASRIEGRVRRILVQPGAQVERGQILAEVDSLEFHNMQLDLLKTRAELDWTRRLLEQLDNLDQSGLVARKELWRLQTKLATLELAEASLVRRLQQVGVPPEESRRLQWNEPGSEEPSSTVLPAIPIRAPADGRVAEFDLAPGEVVPPSKPLFEIQNLSTMWVKGYVFEEDLPRIEVGQPAFVTFAAYPRMRLDGTVVRIAPMLNERPRVMPIRVEIPNPHQRLRDGMRARLTIPAEPVDPTLASE